MHAGVKKELVKIAARLRRVADDLDRNPPASLGSDPKAAELREIAEALERLAGRHVA